MSTSNPFEKLHVRHDKEDDEQGEFEQVKAKDKNVPFGIEQKKKKVRPKEKVEDEGNEGFEEVKNRTTKKRPQNGEDEEVKGKIQKSRRRIHIRNAYFSADRCTCACDAGGCYFLVYQCDLEE